MQMLLYVTDPTNDNEHVVSVSPGQQTTAEKIIVIRFDVMVSFCFFFFDVWSGSVTRFACDCMFSNFNYTTVVCRRDAFCLLMFARRTL